jgi:carbonic anhydrase
MQNFRRILENNHRWVAQMRAADPTFFERLAIRQEPDFLFIGCADSRVPANEVTGTKPGEMFVHRNIANQVYPADLNLLSVLQYAVEVLDVKHIIVCGHYGCGGVKAGMGTVQYGIVDYWLSQIRELNAVYNERLEALPSPAKRLQRLTEMSVVQQVANLARIPVVTNAWSRGKRPILHGVIYDIADGHLRPLVAEVDNAEKARSLVTDLLSVVQAAVPDNSTGGPAIQPPPEPVATALEIESATGPARP